MKYTVKRQIVMTFSVVFSVLLVVMLSGYSLVRGYINQIEYVSPGNNSIITSLPPEYGDEGNDEYPHLDNLPADIILMTDQELYNYYHNSITPISSSHVVNILLIGNDTRIKGTRGRSDAMILVSIDTLNKHINVVSLLRDIYAYIPEVEDYNRLNSAFSFGGPELLLQTVENTFKIKVDKYFETDFFTFADVVDLIGGVEVNIKEDEVNWLNGEIVYYYKNVLGIDGTNKQIRGAGKHTLNGVQALCHVRNRSTASGDFARANRQKDVINQIIAKMKKKNIFEIDELLYKVLPKIRTNLTQNEIQELIALIPTAMDCSIEYWNIPVEESYEIARIKNRVVTTISMEHNRQELWKKLYRYTEDAE